MFTMNLNFFIIKILINNDKRNIMDRNVYTLLAMTKCNCH